MSYLLMLAMFLLAGISVGCAAHSAAWGSATICILYALRSILSDAEHGK